MLATLRYGSSYFCRGPMMLCGTAMTCSRPCVSQTFRTTSSPAYFAIPYGSTGAAGWSSRNGGLLPSVTRHARAVDEALHLLARSRGQQAGRVLVDVLGDDGGRKYAQAFGCDRSAVVDEIDSGEEPLHRIDIPTIGLLELNPLGEVVQIAADHVVAADDFVPALDKCVSEMTAEESSDARDKNLHLDFFMGDGRSRMLRTLRSVPARRGWF